MSTHCSTPFEAELIDLASCVERLTAALAHLQQENQALRHRNEALMGERATLLSKNEQARGHVEAIVGRLKTLEHGATGA